MTLNDTAHRPWPIPGRSHVMAMRWESLLFMHWPVEVALLRPLVPAELSIDTFDGVAWIGVVPFVMSRVRARGLPPVPGLSRFPELNVRTYVTLDGKPGVWFFSLDAAHRLAVYTARRTFHLNYCLAEMSCDASGHVSYKSRRTHRGMPPAMFEATYRPTGVAFRSSPGSLEFFLTERYCLYAQRVGAILRGEITHAPWPLQPATAEVRVNTMADPLGLALTDPPLLHYAHSLDVLAWWPEVARRWGG